MQRFSEVSRRSRLEKRISQCYFKKGRWLQLHSNLAQINVFAIKRIHTTKSLPFVQCVNTAHITSWSLYFFVLAFAALHNRPAYSHQPNA